MYMPQLPRPVERYEEGDVPDSSRFTDPVERIAVLLKVITALQAVNTTLLCALLLR
jgi:hypothetical protein